MAKITVGVITIFNHELQDWELYKGRLEQWFLANDITENEDKSGSKRRAILLSSVAENTYKLLRDLAVPVDVSTLSYNNVVSLLDKHFVPRKCGFAERHKFYSAFQLPDETLAQWAARVRGLALHCGFPAANLDETLRDRFVLGMCSGSEREKIFGKPMEEMTFSTALQLAENVRCARQGSQQISMKPFTSPVDVNKVTSMVERGSGAERAAGRAAYGVPATGSSRITASGASTPSSSKDQCSACGYLGHSVIMCKYSKYKCKLCGNKGHLKKVCPTKRIQFVECCEDGGDDGKFVFNIRSLQGEPMYEHVLVNKINIKFELDSGSAVTVISDDIYFKYFVNVPLKSSTKILQSYNGSYINSLGVITLLFTYKSKSKLLDVFVVKGGGPPLLGRDFLSSFNLQICPVMKCDSNTIDTEIEKIISNYPKLFSDKLGCCKNVVVSLHLKEGSKPIFFKARSIPFAIRNKVEKEIDRLIAVGILKPVSYSEYASPIVPVLKRDNSIRLCADYSVTINKQLIIDKYPLPKIEELFAKLHGCRYFTKLDLSSAYNQCRLSEDSQRYTCINTHKGLYKFTRLVFGLASAPAIFQRVMETVLRDMPGVLLFQDDILVTGKSKEEHIIRLQEVFNRLENSGLVLQKSKCNFFQNSVSYLGYIIDVNGLHKSPDKVQAILKAKSPNNVSELKSFLGLVNYYRNFVKNASTILSPMHNLLKKNVPWNWQREHECAFNTIKRDLCSDTTLAHFNPDAKLIVTVDASPSGLGAVLSQVGSDGLERPVSYASRALIPAEKQYSQIQKEATAIIFGVRKFHYYLYGRDIPFVLRTDHKPLLSIFRPDKGIPEITANRLQRYSIFLSAYNYKIEYVASAHNCADFLSRSTVIDTALSQSRLDAADVSQSHTDRATYINFVVDGSMPLTLSDIVIETRNDNILKLVTKYVLSGCWPNKPQNELKPYLHCRSELAIENDCLMRGYKLIIPQSLRERVLAELHKGHMGIPKMKSQARVRFWWPGLPAAIEQYVARCNVCSKLRPAPAHAPLSPWPYPKRPWERVHIDFLGPFYNKVYLIIVDAYSKWVEVYDVTSGYSSKVVIDKLCEVMARFGLFQCICSDNGSSFTSTEFSDFCKMNGIQHITTPTYNPASNGQAESYVKIVKKGLKGILLSGISIKNVNAQLHEFLFHYRNSTHSTTDKSPAQIIFGHQLYSRLDLLNAVAFPPSDTALTKNVKKNQSLQCKYYGGIRKKTFAIGDQVLVKIYKNQKSSWAKGVIEKRLGSSIYLVMISELNIRLKKHINQILQFKGEDNDNSAIPTNVNSELNQSQFTSDIGEATNFLLRNPSTSEKLIIETADDEEYNFTPTVNAGEMSQECSNPPTSEQAGSQQSEPNVSPPKPPDEQLQMASADTLSYTDGAPTDVTGRPTRSRHRIDYRKFK